jgi:hypothetical protein
MKFGLAFILLAAVAAGAFEGPDETLQRFYSAVVDGDGYRATCYFSDDAFARFTEQLTELRADPAAGVAALGNIGVSTTVTKLENWDEIDFAAAMIGSDAVQAIAASAVPSGNITLDGIHAYAEVITTIPGLTVQIPLVIENKRWKLDAVDALGISSLLFAL